MAITGLRPHFPRRKIFFLLRELVDDNAPCGELEQSHLLVYYSRGTP